MKKIGFITGGLFVAFATIFGAFTNNKEETDIPVKSQTVIQENVEDEKQEQSAIKESEKDVEASEKKSAKNKESSLNEWDYSPYEIRNENIPDFTEEEKHTEAFESYSELDALGRCGVAYANIGPELLPTEERESIGKVKPTGFQTVKYDFVDGRYLYNRSHLIGYQLTGENANEKNLITGTRYMNVEGMLPFENEVYNYIEETGNHVLYRVTPVYEEDNLVADGVIMEAWSVEDEGEGICFHVYVYNKQPGVEIDYKTGESKEAEKVDEELEKAQAWELQSEVTQKEDAKNEAADDKDETKNNETKEETLDYVFNTNSKKFHLADCESVSDMKEENKEAYTGVRSDVINMGYEPCKRCEP